MADAQLFISDLRAALVKPLRNLRAPQYHMLVEIYPKTISYTFVEAYPLI